MRRSVAGRGSRPRRKSNTNLGSPTASLPNRVGLTCVWRKNFSTSLNKVTLQFLTHEATRLLTISQGNSYLSRHLPIFKVERWNRTLGA